MFNRLKQFIQAFKAAYLEINRDKLQVKRLINEYNQGIKFQSKLYDDLIHAIDYLNADKDFVDSRMKPIYNILLNYLESGMRYDKESNSCTARMYDKPRKKEVMDAIQCNETALATIKHHYKTNDYVGAIKHDLKRVESDRPVSVRNLIVIHHYEDN